LFKSFWVKVNKGCINKRGVLEVLIVVKEIFNNLNIPFSVVNLCEAIKERKLSAVEKEQL
jgi:hypothetical protein